MLAAMDRPRAIFLALVLGTLPLTGHAERVRERTGITVGLSSRWIEFDYTSDAELEKDVPTPAGVMTRDLGTTLLLRLDAPLDRQAHFLIEAGLSPFDLSRQSIDDRERTRDLGTRVQGLYAHLTPMVAAFVPSKTPLPLRYGIGLGVGVGYLRARGDMILTEDGSNTRREVDIAGFGLSFALFLQIEYDRWQSRVQAAGPMLDRDGGAYSMNILSWDLGYRFAF